VIAGMPEDPENPWGVTPFRKVSSQNSVNDVIIACAESPTVTSLASLSCVSSQVLFQDFVELGLDGINLNIMTLCGTTWVCNTCPEKTSENVLDLNFFLSGSEAVKLTFVL